MSGSLYVLLLIQLRRLDEPWLVGCLFNLLLLWGFHMHIHNHIYNHYNRSSTPSIYPLLWGGVSVQTLEWYEFPPFFWKRYLALEILKKWRPEADGRKLSSGFYEDWDGVGGEGVGVKAGGGRAETGLRRFLPSLYTHKSFRWGFGMNSRVSEIHKNWTKKLIGFNIFWGLISTMVLYKWIFW